MEPRAQKLKSKNTSRRLPASSSRIKKISFILIIFFSIKSHANIEIVKQNVEKLINTHFKELKISQIKVEPFNSPLYFFETDIKLQQLLKLAKNREYILRYNPKIFKQKDPISKLALNGILIHELQHIYDYYKMNLWQLSMFYFKYLTIDSFKAKYERDTDYKAALRAKQDLLKYKIWHNRQLPPSILAKKEKYYLSIKEVEKL